MSICHNCNAENLTDKPLCPSCQSSHRFAHRADCECGACKAKALEIVETNGLSEPQSLMLFDFANPWRPSISEAVRIIGNYAYFPGFGWHRYVTLASVTWNKHLY